MLETPRRIEPCFFEVRVPAELADLSAEIQRAADGLGQARIKNACIVPCSAAEQGSKVDPGEVQPLFQRMDGAGLVT